MSLIEVIIIIAFIRTQNTMVQTRYVTNKNIFLFLFMASIGAHGKELFGTDKVKNTLDFILAEARESERIPPEL